MSVQMYCVFNHVQWMRLYAVVSYLVEGIFFLLYSHSVILCLPFHFYFYKQRKEGQGSCFDLSVYFCSEQAVSLYNEHPLMMLTRPGITIITDV